MLTTIIFSLLIRLIASNPTFYGVFPPFSVEIRLCGNATLLRFTSVIKIKIIKLPSVFWDEYNCYA